MLPNIFKFLTTRYAMELLSQGAEAVLYSHDGHILKVRVPKGYRHPELDASLRARRTRREAKVLSRISGVIDAPKLVCFSDGKKVQGDCPENFGEKATGTFIVMEYIDGDRLKDVLSSRNLKSLMRNAGTSVGKMHSSDIVHGDLTTSNMIRSGKRLYMIDFGLSQFSEKLEDKAVDLHLMLRSLESGHPGIWEKCSAEFLDAYTSSYEGASAVLDRLEAVEKRGRNKTKAR